MANVLYTAICYHCGKLHGVLCNAPRRLKAWAYIAGPLAVIAAAWHPVWHFIARILGIPCP